MPAFTVSGLTGVVKSGSTYQFKVVLTGVFDAVIVFRSNKSPHVILVDVELNEGGVVPASQSA